MEKHGWVIDNFEVSVTICTILIGKTEIYTLEEFFLKIFWFAVLITLQSIQGTGTLEP